MNASCQTLLPACTHKIDNNDIEPSPQIIISEREYSELKWEVGYWQSLHQRSILREIKLKQTIKEKEGQIRDLKNRVFGKKSEKKSASKDTGKFKPDKPKRPRGQQPGSKGHGRTKRPDLPDQKEAANFLQNPICPNCSKPYVPDENKGAEIIEVEVKAYTRKIIRQCMKKDCSCKGLPATITAPMPSKVIPKSPYGISIMEAVLLSKFHYCQPPNRLLNQYK